MLWSRDVFIGRGAVTCGHFGLHWDGVGIEVTRARDVFMGKGAVPLCVADRGCRASGAMWPFRCRWERG